MPEVIVEVVVPAIPLVVETVEQAPPLEVELGVPGPPGPPGTAVFDDDIALIYQVAKL